MRCVLHPDGLPDVLIDRSLGRIQVPSLLRTAGLRLITLAEHYGIPADEDIEDVTWLKLAGQSNWIVFMKDAQIRRRPAERAVCQDLRRPRILPVCRQPGCRTHGCPLHRQPASDDRGVRANGTVHLRGAQVAHCSVVLGLTHKLGRC